MLKTHGRYDYFALPSRPGYENWCDNLRDQFDELFEESRRRPLVMPIVLHSFVVGQPYRLRQFRRVAAARDGAGLWSRLCQEGLGGLPVK